MGTRQGRTAARAKGTESKSSKKGKRHADAGDRNQSRRKQYANDEAYREGVKKQARASYRKTLDKPRKQSPLASGPLVPPKQREVYVADDEGTPLSDPYFEDCYNVSESAQALQKTRVTLHRWISDKLIPPPILMDTSRGYLHYSEEEMKLIAKYIAEHEKEFEYLHYTHTTTINQIWQNIEAVRK